VNPDDGARACVMVELGSPQAIVGVACKGYAVAGLRSFCTSYSRSVWFGVGAGILYLGFGGRRVGVGAEGWDRHVDGDGSEGARLGLGVVALGLGRYGGGVDGDGFGGSGRGGGSKGEGVGERFCGAGLWWRS